MDGWKELMEKKEHIFLQKIIFTILIILVYLIGRELPLYGIDVSAYIGKSPDAQDILMQTISGDVNKCSLFALGVSPYMAVSIIVQMVLSLRSSEARARISPRKVNRVLVGATFVWAAVQAVAYSGELIYRVKGNDLILARGVASIEMVTGVLIILWLSERNKKYGIGGQTALIFVNIVDSIIVSLTGHEGKAIVLPLVISFIVMFIMLIMENTQKRIPVQRISIHNIYADKNYLAVKLNPIGVMPVMFATAFFVVPQILVRLLGKLFPDSGSIHFLVENIVLTKPLGIVIYIIIIYLLTVIFSVVFISPGDITEQFLKSGDSILNLHAGADTKKYLTRVVRRLSAVSATVMSVCVGGPLLLQLFGGMDSTLVMLPSTFMMLTGIWCNLYQDGLAVKNLDEYRPFI
jgi:preprotein translocase subunit SecY